MSEDRRLTIIYHNNCYDGVTAAWICWKRFQGERPNLRAIPRNYSDPIPEDIDGDDVVVVDFSWPWTQMNDLYHRCESLVILDHHKTAQEALEKLMTYDGDPKFSMTFDMNRSGAGIAWDYFFNKETRPDLVNYVEDRDLWRFALPNSREINAYIQSYDINLKVWSDTWPDGILHDDCQFIGEALLRQQSKLVKSIAEHARPVMLPTPTKISPEAIDLWRDLNLDGQPGMYVDTTILMSEVCEQMLADHPEARYAYYSFRRKDGKQQYGLRSRAGSDFDVSAIAKLYGGGGHKHAAGFEI